VGVPTHVMEYSGRTVTTLSRGAGPLQFAGPLRRLDGTERWCLVLYALPAGKSYEDIAGQGADEYLQAAGSADKMVVEIRKPAGQQWGVEWVRFVVGHPHGDSPPRDESITLPDTTEKISRPELFEAEEAAELFLSYYRTGDIPAGYVLRPVEGYTTDGQIVDLTHQSA
jgi:hypothetical protein